MSNNSESDIGVSADRHAQTLLLNREQLAERYTSLLTHSGSSTMVGLLAPWGSGKTSLIKRIETLLTTEGKVDKLDPAHKSTIGSTKTTKQANEFYQENIKCLHFSAWDHENPGGLVVSMMSELAHQFEDKAILNAFIEVAGSLTGIGTDLALRAITGNQISLKDWNEASEIGKQSFRELQQKLLNEYLHDEHNKLETNLRESGKALGSIGTTRIVLLIDDLDRSNPDNIFQFLDSLRRLLSLTETIDRQDFLTGAEDGKNIVKPTVHKGYNPLNGKKHSGPPTGMDHEKGAMPATEGNKRKNKFEGFVGIIAADPEVIRQAIWAKYPLLKGDPLCYMDKLFTVTHTLPTPDKRDWDHYLTAQCEAQGIPSMIKLLRNDAWENITRTHFTNHLKDFIVACDGALTLRHANIFLRHLKIAINTQAQNPYKYFNLEVSSPEWRVGIGLALVGIVSPRHFNILRSLGDESIHIVPFLLQSMNKPTPSGKTIPEQYRKQTGRTWDNDWTDFSFAPLVSGISSKSTDQVKAAAELIWL